VKKLILVAGLMGCTAVQGFAQIDKRVYVHEPFTISSMEDATSGAEYRWRRNNIILGAGAASYSGSELTAGTYTFIREARKGALCDWRPSNPFVVAVVEGDNQQQGSCTFTQPPVVGTFAAFDPNYSASTFVTLTDERDRNNYTVVKMPDGKWWMAQNLNYQKDLVWNRNSNEANGSAFTTTTNGIPAIGSFWCPAGVDGAMATVSSANRAGCAVYGALYTWETVMMVDGKWSDELHNSSNFVEPVYSTNTAAGNTNNGGRGATKRGICPPNWHVPTDDEWGNMLNLSGTKGTDFNNGRDAWLGVNDDAGESGARLKATCTCPFGNTGCVDDTKSDWLYSPFAANEGTDIFGFRVVPANRRWFTGEHYEPRGREAAFWSSSSWSETYAWRRNFSFESSMVRRSECRRGSGQSVRCVVD
jgi:uncharacterized protein (TIGR02145 family)